MEFFDPLGPWESNPEMVVPAPDVLSPRTRYTIRDYWTDCAGVRWTYRISRLWYYLKCKFWHRYNVVVVRTEPPTWRDRSDFLLPLMMQVLTDFIEQEKPFEFTDTSYRHDVYYSLKDLYEWWHIRRPARESAYHAMLIAASDDANPDPNRYAKVWAQEQQNVDEDDVMMRRLIALRHYMWT